MACSHSASREHLFLKVCNIYLNLLDNVCLKLHWIYWAVARLLQPKRVEHSSMAQLSARTLVEAIPPGQLALAVDRVACFAERCQQRFLLLTWTVWAWRGGARISDEQRRWVDRVAACEVEMQEIRTNAAERFEQFEQRWTDFLDDPSRFLRFYLLLWRQRVGVSRLVRERRADREKANALSDAAFISREGHQDICLRLANQIVEERATSLYSLLISRSLRAWAVMAHRAALDASIEACETARDEESQQRELDADKAMAQLRMNRFCFATRHGIVADIFAGREVLARCISAWYCGAQREEVARIKKAAHNQLEEAVTESQRSHTLRCACFLVKVFADQSVTLRREMIMALWFACTIGSRAKRHWEERNTADTVMFLEDRVTASTTRLRIQLWQLADFVRARMQTWVVLCCALIWKRQIELQRVGRGYTDRINMLEEVQRTAMFDAAETQLDALQVVVRLMARRHGTELGHQHLLAWFVAWRALRNSRLLELAIAEARHLGQRFERDIQRQIEMDAENAASVTSHLMDLIERCLPRRGNFYLMAHVVSCWAYAVLETYIQPCAEELFKRRFDWLHETKLDTNSLSSSGIQPCAITDEAGGNNIEPIMSQAAAKLVDVLERARRHRLAFAIMHLFPPPRPSNRPLAIRTTQGSKSDIERNASNPLPTSSGPAFVVRQPGSDPTFDIGATSFEKRRLSAENVMKTLDHLAQARRTLDELSLKDVSGRLRNELNGLDMIAAVATNSSTVSETELNMRWAELEGEQSNRPSNEREGKEKVQTDDVRQHVDSAGQLLFQGQPDS
eukprot:TRINITY_DN24280_c0_g1_i1.p1 TRINITY_DN24280_c0_g1~~TRINITY_DN24280_c0_g1_i1.p1  ORF type:complete len:815 (+),score=105.42 TRINITY_DN24280_c0_g1_i1:54-2447(+)